MHSFTHFSHSGSSVWKRFFSCIREHSFSFPLSERIFIEPCRVPGFIKKCLLLFFVWLTRRQHKHLLTLFLLRMLTPSNTSSLNTSTLNPLITGKNILKSSKHGSPGHACSSPLNVRILTNKRSSSHKCLPSPFYKLEHTFVNPIIGSRIVSINPLTTFFEQVFINPSSSHHPIACNFSFINP